MNRVKQILMAAIIVAAVGSAVPFEAIGAPFCLPPHRLFILDLDVVPDPIHQGQPVAKWIVTLRSDYNGECATRLVVRDKDQIAGTEVQHSIRPGVARYDFPANPAYRFQAQDLCYRVLANIGGTLTPIDATRVFCAKYKPPVPPGWSLK